MVKIDVCNEAHWGWTRWRVTALLWLRVWVYCRCAAAAPLLTPCTMWEPGASPSKAKPPVFPCQWGPRAAVSPFPGWENNPLCFEDKGQRGKPLTAIGEGEEVSKGGNIWNESNDASMLCVVLLLTRLHKYIHTHGPKSLSHTHTTHITVVQPGDTELSAFYSSQPTVMGLIPPPSLSPSGCLLMRDAVKRMGTVSPWLKCSSGAS